MVYYFSAPSEHYMVGLSVTGCGFSVLLSTGKTGHRKYACETNLASKTPPSSLCDRELWNALYHMLTLLFYVLSLQIFFPMLRQ